MEQIVRKTKCRISVALCPYREYLLRRRSSFTHQEQVAQKQRDDYDKQMEKWRRIYNRVNHEQKVISRQSPGEAKRLKKKMHSGRNGAGKSTLLEILWDELKDRRDITTVFMPQDYSEILDCGKNTHSVSRRKLYKG